MNAELLKEAVALLGGVDNVFSFTYDNAGRVFFNSERPFSLDMIEGEFLKMTGASMEGLPVIELKPIETIQTIVGVEKPEDRDVIDMHYFRS